MHRAADPETGGRAI